VCPLGLDDPLACGRRPSGARFNLLAPDSSTATGLKSFRPRSRFEKVAPGAADVTGTPESDSMPR
jgi:hypothetical protein